MAFLLSLYISLISLNTFGSDTPINHFEACNGYFKQVSSDNTVLCKEVEQKVDQIETTTKNVYKAVKQLHFNDEKSSIPSSVRSHILSSIKNQYESLNLDLTKCDLVPRICWEQESIKQTLNIATAHFEEFKLLSALTFTEKPSLIQNNNNLISGARIIGGKYPVKPGDEIKIPIDGFSQIQIDKKTADTVNDIVLLTIVQSSPNLQISALKDIETPSSEEIIRHTHKKMLQPESITNSYELGERYAYDASLKRLQKESKAKYIELLSKYPVLAYLKSSTPSQAELMGAVKKVKNNLDHLYWDAENTGSNAFEEMDLLHFKVELESYLNANPSQCLSVNLLYSKGLKKREWTDIGIGTGVAIANIGCPFILKGALGRAGCMFLSGQTAVWTIEDQLELADKLRFQAFSKIESENNRGEILNDLFKQESSNNYLLATTAVSAIPFLKQTTINTLDRLGVFKIGSVVPGKGTGFKYAANFQKYANIKFSKFKPKPVSTQLSLDSKSLPEKIQTKLQDMKNYAKNNQLDSPNINYMNGLTNAKKGETVLKVLNKYPRMQKPIIHAHQRFSDTGAWADYLEGSIGKIYKKMLSSSNPKIVEMAKQGKIDDKTLSTP